LRVVGGEARRGGGRMRRGRMFCIQRKAMIAQVVGNAIERES